MLASFPWTTRCEAKPTRTPSARSVRAAAGAAPTRARKAPRAARRIRDAGALTDTSIDLRLVASVAAFACLARRLNGRSVQNRVRSLGRVTVTPVMARSAKSGVRPLAMARSDSRRSESAAQRRNARFGRAPFSQHRGLTPGAAESAMHLWMVRAYDAAPGAQHQAFAFPPPRGPA